MKWMNPPRTKETKTLMSDQTISASFRDPSGFLFTREQKLYRQVNRSYQDNYDQLLTSGLYEKLVKAQLLIPHKEVNIEAADPSLAYMVIEPERVHFISYPYEWSFSQLKDAALTTLRIQRLALRHGMTLKDASAYNIQFNNGKTTLIDTLSFEEYQNGKPWAAYRQFCQHFLAPLALMAKKDIRLIQLLRIYIDGVPLDLASELLPFSTRLDFGLLSHLHLHAKAQNRYARTAADISFQQKRSMSKASLMGFLEHLENTIKKLNWLPSGTEWAEYYSITNYSEVAFKHKQEMINEWLTRVSPSSVWDLGANDGEFTRLASEKGISSVAFDIDPAAVEKNYQRVKKEQSPNLLPLVLDLTNPSPSLGWHNQERQSLLDRGPSDMVFALALIHHLAISNNVPLSNTAEFFRDAGRWLIIEFVPKSDSMVQKLLSSRLDIFDRYTNKDFEKAYESCFLIHERVNLRESERVLYLMERK
jgi:ribosomal protein L11 methylase PrmA